MNMSQQDAYNIVQLAKQEKRRLQSEHLKGLDIPFASLYNCTPLVFGFLYIYMVMHPHSFRDTVAISLTTICIITLSIIGSIGVNSSIPTMLLDIIMVIISIIIKRGMSTSTSVMIPEIITFISFLRLCGSFYMYNRNK